MWHRNQKRITAAEGEHLERVRALGCCACIKFGLVWLWPVEAHHLLHAGRRIGHHAVVGLCPSHHRGTPFTLYQTLMIPREARVSIASGSRAFARVYGSELDLWRGVQRKLGLPADLPATKILPRRLA